MIRDADGHISRIPYVLPRHKAANWVGRARGRKSKRPGANRVVELSPFEFLDRLADLVPPPRKHRHHGVFKPNHKLRRAVTSLVIGNDAPLTSKKSGRVVFQPRPLFLEPTSHYPAQARHTARYPHEAQPTVDGAG